MKKILFALPIVVFLSSCQQLGIDSSKVTNVFSGSSEEISMTEMCGDFRNNAYGAGKKWIGKSIVFESQIDKIGNGGFGFDINSARVAGYITFSSTQSVTGQIMDQVGVATSTRTVADTVSGTKLNSYDYPELLELKNGQMVKASGTLDQVRILNNGICYINLSKGSIKK